MSQIGLLVLHKTSLWCNVSSCPGQNLQKRVWDKHLVVEVLPCEDIVPEHTDLEVPGVRNCAGSVYLTDDLLCLAGGIVNVEHGRHLCAILHVLPVIDVEFSHLAIQFAQV